MNMSIIYTALRSLTVYRDILSEPVIDSAAGLCGTIDSSCASDEERIDAYCEVYHRLIGSGHKDLAGYIEEYLRYDEGAYPAAVASGGGKQLRAAARRDIDILGRLEQGCGEMKSLLLETLSPRLRDIVDDLPEIEAAKCRALRVWSRAIDVRAGASLPEGVRLCGTSGA